MPADPTKRRWVALIRAINGSPANRIRMLDLAHLLEGAGCENVTWHIHTGNLFITAAAEREKVADAITDRLHAHGMRNAWAMVWSPDELRTLVASQPFAGFDAGEYVLEVSFFDAPPQSPDTQFLTDLGAIVAALDDRVLCLAIPKEFDGTRSRQWLGGANGIIERRWNIWATTRAWNVVEQIADRAT